MKLQAVTAGVPSAKNRTKKIVMRGHYRKQHVPGTVGVSRDEPPIILRSLVSINGERPNCKHTKRKAKLARKGL